jgi:hypothetical protein
MICQLISGGTVILSFIISVNFHNTIHSAYESESMDCVKTFGLLHLLLCLEGGRVKARDTIRSACDYGSCTLGCRRQSRN